MLAYATPDDLASWLPDETEVVGDARRLLRAASRLVRDATVTAVYDVNPVTNLPLLERVRHALRDATCAQAETWLALDIDPVAGPAGAVTGLLPAATSIGGASVQYATSVTGDDVRRAAVTTLSAEAVAILADAGLTGGPVATL